MVGTSLTVIQQAGREDILGASTLSSSWIVGDSISRSLSSVFVVLTGAALRISIGTGKCLQGEDLVDLTNNN